MPTDGDKPHLAISKRDGKGAGPAMTAREPQQEYIITEEIIKKAIELDKSAYDKSDELEELLCSCPHPAPAPEEHEDGCRCLGCTAEKGRDDEFYCKHVTTLKTEAARKAREDVLALLEEWDYLNIKNFLKPHPVFADMIRLVREKPNEVRDHLKLLRQQDKGEQENTSSREV